MLKRLFEAGPLTLAQLLAMSVRHFSSIRRVYFADARSRLGKLRQHRPELLGMVLTPFVSAEWGAKKRFQVTIEHCDYVESIGWPLDVSDHEYLVLGDLSTISTGLHIELAAPRWLAREGLLSLALVEEETLVFSLSFTLGHIDEIPVAYIGGLQGGADALAVARRLTRLACGMRPRDLLIEAFRIVCRFYNVERILAVSDATRIHRSPYLRARESDPVVMRYDTVWHDRGGQKTEGGFFELPVTMERRTHETIRPNKRTEYRRRYAMLDDLETVINHTLEAGQITDNL